MSLHPDAIVLDSRPSGQFRQESLRGATWVLRPTLIGQLSACQGRPVLLLGNNAGKLALLAADLEEAGHGDVHVCVVGGTDLRDSGLPLQANSDMPDGACIDYLFFVHDRHDGNKEAARRYLEWETNLVSQIDEQERGTFLIDV